MGYDTILLYSTRENFANICQIEWNWIRSMKFKAVRIHFLSDVFSLLSSKNSATMTLWRKHLPTLGCSALGWQRGFSLFWLSVFLHNEFLSGCAKTQITCVCLLKAHIRWFQKIKIKMFMFVCFLIGACYTLNIRSRGKQLVLFEKHQDLRENITKWKTWH